jgi:dsRNA-specific ribonuclease
MNPKKPTNEETDENRLNNLIYNEKNVLITSKAIRTIIGKYLDPDAVKEKLESLLKQNSKVSNEALPIYQMAFTHDSYVKRNVMAEPDKAQNKRKKFALGVTKDELENNEKEDGIVELQNESYERLEFLGDSVLHPIITEYLFFRFPKEGEGFLTKLRTKLENNEQVGSFAEKLGLPKYILMSKQVESANGRKNINTWCDTLEAFLGAMFLDVGYYACQSFVIKMLEDNVDIAEILKNDTNYKDLLMRTYHQLKWGNPIYIEEGSSGLDHERVFRICVKDNNGRKIGRGSAGTKRKAEQLAAKMALIHLGVLKEGNEEIDSEKEKKH